MDWREMFKKYCNIVGEEEGVYFLYESDWSKREWAEIEKILDEIEKELLEGKNETNR